MNAARLAPVRRSLALMVGAVQLLALSSEPVVARAQEDPAVTDPRQQYALGKEAYAAKRYAEAALHFEAAAANKPHAVTLFTAGLAWDQASRPERAADAFSRCMEVPGLDAKQLQTAKDRLAQLEKSLGTLVVSAPEGTRVQLGNLTEVRTPARVHAAPGTHTLTIRFEGKPIERRDVSLENAQVQKLSLEVAVPKEVPKEVEPEPPPPPPPPPPKVEAKPVLDLRKAGGFGLVGLGAASFISGVILGLQANGAQEAYSKAPTRESFDHANSLATWCTVSLVFSGLFVGGGVALILWPEPEKTHEKTPLPGEAPSPASGSGFTSPRVLFGPTGATVRGTF